MTNDIKFTNPTTLTSKKILPLKVNNFKSTDFESVEQEETEIIESFSFDLTTWEPDHLHWVAPSKIILYSNGDLVATASHIANMRRTGGIFDTGERYSAVFDLALLENETDSKSIITLTYAIATLNYKDGEDNIVRKWNLPGLPPFIEKANFASLTQRWNHGIVPPATTIPIGPPITFP